jgi:hypothetical protein
MNSCEQTYNEMLSKKQQLLKSKEISKSQISTLIIYDLIFPVVIFIIYEICYFIYILFYLKDEKLHSLSNSHPLSVESLIGNNKIEENKYLNKNCDRQEEEEQEPDEEEMSAVKKVLKQEESIEVLTIMEFVKNSVKSLDNKLQLTLNNLNLQLQNETKLRFQMEKKAQHLTQLQKHLKRQLKIQRAIVLLKKSTKKPLRLNRK